MVYIGLGTHLVATPAEAAEIAQQALAGRQGEATDIQILQKVLQKEQK